ncbi:DNA primase, partial [Acinetobacter baumannii]
EPTQTKIGDLKLPKAYDLPIMGQNLKYLKERNITLDTCREFGLKFCQKGWFAYIGPTGEKQYQNYSMRIIIPVRDLEGKL